MSDCKTCQAGGHPEEEVIYVDGKAFCPNSLNRIWTEEEGEEMSDAELEAAATERIKLVKPAKPAKYEIVK